MSLPSIQRMIESPTADVDLSDQSLMKLSDEMIENLSKRYTRKLSLRKNKLLLLNVDISKLGLEELDVSDNLLYVIPFSIGDMSKLVCLNLSFNKILKLPPQIGNLQLLEALYLQNVRFFFLINSSYWITS